jgi:hypothetical protein
MVRSKILGCFMPSIKMTMTRVFAVAKGMV